MFEESRDFWDRLPFIGRVFLTASLALIIAASVMLFTSARHEAADIRNDLSLQLENELDTIPATLAEIIVVGDYSRLQQTLDRFVKRPIISRIVYNDPKNNRIESIDPAVPSEAPMWFVHQFDLLDVVGQTTLTIGGRSYGTLEVTLSPNSQINRAWGHPVRHLQILLLAIVLDVFGIWLVLRHGIAPLQRLVMGVREFAVTHEPVDVRLAGSREIRELILAFNDMVTEVAYQQHELASAKNEAEAMSIAKSRFLATMSHEIRTPMNGILGMTQLLMMPGLTEEEIKDYVRTIHESGTTLLVLLNDILDLSKVESGKMVLEQIPFMPTQLIHDVGMLFHETAANKGLELRYQWLSDSNAAFIGDPHRIRQMLNNLLSNAIKFSTAGQIILEGRKLSPQIDDEPETVTLEFSVQDSGVGIPPEKLALLFKPFSQVDTSTTRKYGGTGLGLSIVKNLAELMKGSVSVESQPGQGSRFSFTCKLRMTDELG